MNNLTSICVFCGSSDLMARSYIIAAEEMGRLIAKRRLKLIYGAGKTGLMGALATSCLMEGGTVIGITPENLNTPVLIHQNLTRLEVTPDIHTRKARMHELADAFIALPGGYGTYDELFEALTWAQIGLHGKPVGLLNTNRYYDPVLAMVDRAQAEGFIYPEHKDLLVHSTNPEELLDLLIHFQKPSSLERWVNRS